MATLSSELLALLADPETHEPLALATPDELARLRALLSSGKASRRGGQALPTNVEGALLSREKRIAYLVEDGIPNLLIDERIELADAL